MDELIYRQAAIDTLDVGAELLRRVLDDTDIVGIERKKYEWGLNLIESYIADMKELPPAQPEHMSVNLRVEKLSKHQSDFSDLDAQSDWNEMIVMCDCCGHAIHVKRIEVERKSDA